MVAPKEVVVAAPPLGGSAAIEAAIRPRPPLVNAADEYTIPLREVVDEKNGIVGNTKGIPILSFLLLCRRVSCGRHSALLKGRRLAAADLLA